MKNFTEDLFSPSEYFEIVQLMIKQIISAGHRINVYLSVLTTFALYEKAKN